MLGWILEKTTAVVSETYDVVAAGADYIIEDIKSIPDSVEAGWNDGLFTSDESTEEKPAEPNDI